MPKIVAFDLHHSNARDQFQSFPNQRSWTIVGTLGTHDSFARQQVRPQAQRQSLKLWMAARKARGSYHLPFAKRFFIILFLRSFLYIPIISTISTVFQQLLSSFVAQSVKSELNAFQVKLLHPPRFRRQNMCHPTPKSSVNGRVPTSNIIQPVSFMEFQQFNDGACSEYDILQTTSITW